MSEWTFKEEGHAHFHDGKRKKGCTTILGVIAKPFLIQWAADVAAVKALDIPELTDRYESIAKLPHGDEKAALKKQLDKDFPQYSIARKGHIKKKETAADWGKIVHKAIEMWIGSKAVPTAVEIAKENYLLLPEHLAAINNFVDWATANNVEFLQSEKQIHSDEWDIGGIVDFVGRYNGKLWVGDVKTSSFIDETHILQVSSYAKMMMEMGMYDSFDGMVIVNCKKDGTLLIEERQDITGNIRCFEAALLLHNRLDV